MRIHLPGPFDIMGYLKTCCNTLLPSPSFMEKLVRLDARIRKGIDAFKSDNKDPDISLVLQLLQKSFAISDLPLALSILSVPISDGTKLRAALGSVGSSLGYSRLNLAYVFHISSSKPKPPAKEEVEILRSLLKDLRHAVDLEGADDSGLTLIHKAAAFGIIDLVNDLCELGVSTTALDKDARTPLHLAVSAAHPWDVAEKLVRALAKAGPEILSPGWAPLTPPPKPVVFKALRTMIPKKNAKLSDLIDKVGLSLLHSLILIYLARSLVIRSQLNRELNVASSSKAKGNEGKSKKIAQAALQDSALQSSAPPPGVIDNEAESSAEPVVIQSEEVAPPVIAQIEPLETLSSLSVMEIKDLWETSIRSNERRSEEMLDKLISSLPFDLVLDLDGPVPSASSSAPRPDSYRTDEALRAVVEEVLPDGERNQGIWHLYHMPTLISSHVQSTMTMMSTRTRVTTMSLYSQLLMHHLPLQSLILQETPPWTWLPSKLLLTGLTACHGSSPLQKRQSDVGGTCHGPRRS